jgi:hypothetical protein
LIAALLLALFVMALFYRLLLTNRVLASGDILLYFYPYRSYAAAAFQEGRIPLWNPYIFSGAPFLANIQAGVLYPLHWPLNWLPVTQQIYWSAAIHAWILGMGGYVLLRRWGYGWLAGLVTALTLAGSGFYGGMIGHLNQMNGAAWLPWMLWVLENNPRYDIPTTGSRLAKLVSLGASHVGGVALFSLLVTLTLLAGHTQTAYINLFGVGIWLVAREVDVRAWVSGIRNWATKRPGLRRLARPNVHSLFSGLLPLLPGLGVYFLGILLALLLSAAQLLPTLELNQLGLRSGGLSYWEVTSFSLRPLRLPWTIFPTYGLVDLSTIWGPAFTEFVAHVGLTGLLLAAIGFWRSRWSRAWRFGLLFVGLGIFLALGRWNPAYYLLYQFAPGFDLFRTPARWMMLYTVGIAVLAGVGAEIMRDWAIRRLRDWRGGIHRPQLLISQSPNHPISPHTSISFLVLLILSTDLLLAARSLPHTQPTAPQAVYDVRTAPAYLLTDPARALHPAAMGRFLSLSTIEFDPGDMADWRRIYREGKPPQLDEEAFLELIIALKAQEILAPNLPLFWQVPAADGFDGGILPLQRYNELMTLLIPRDELVPDGRIREQLRTVPPADLLRLMNVRYVITDKVRDLWFENVYYDRQIGATLASPSPVQVEVDAPYHFKATAIGVIGFVEADADVWEQLSQGNQPVAQLAVIVGGETVQTLPLLAGGEAGAHFADGRIDSAMAAQAGAVVAFQDVEQGRQEYLAWLELDAPLSPDMLRFEHTGSAGVAVTVQAVTLVDERTESFRPLVASDRGRFRLVHSGDVKIYAALDVESRAYLATTIEAAASPAEALDRMQQQGQLDGYAVVEADASLLTDKGIAGAGGGGAVELLEYGPERIVVQTQSEEPALLVLADAFYPGWTATVAGQPAEIIATNLLYRGAPIPAGEQTVVFEYRPDSWRRGLQISLVGWVLLVGLAVVGVRWGRKVPFSVR